VNNDIINLGTHGVMGFLSLLLNCMVRKLVLGIYDIMYYPSLQRRYVMVFLRVLPRAQPKGGPKEKL